MKLHIKTVLPIIVTLLLLFLLVGCLPGLTPPTPKGVISGRVMVPSSEAAKDITGWVPAANATVTLTDSEGVTHTVTTDENGYYTFTNVAVNTDTIITATATIDGNTVVMKDVVPQAVAAIEDYDSGTMTPESTALGLIVEELTEQGLTSEDINLQEIQASDNFTEVVEQVSSVLEENGNVTTDPDVTEVVNDIVEEIINPPTPEPEPTPTPTYTVTFDKNDGDATGTMSAQTISSGTSAALTACTFTKTGWTFAGWATTSVEDVVYANQASYTMGTSNVTLYAKWTANDYTITFDKNDGDATGTMSAQTISSGTSAALTACTFTKTGWTFAGWAETSGGAVVYTDEESYTMGTANVTLYAKWTINTYTLTMNKTGSGTGTTTPTEGTHTYDYGTSVTISASPASSSIFTGWSGAATGTSDVTLTMTENKSVTATFTLKTYTITATAGSNGTINPSGATTVNHGANQSFTITAAANYHIADVLVDGTSEGAITSYAFINVTADHTIAASFVINTYTVTYNGNGNTGGSVPTDSNTYQQGVTVTVLGNSGSLVKTGYGFVGWNTQADCNGTDRTVGSTFNMGASNVTLYAKWNINIYTVTYDGNGFTGGSVPTDSNNPYQYGATVTVRGNTRSLIRINDGGTSYCFTGWNTKADGSGNGETDYTAGDTFNMGVSNVTLYAQWRPYALRDPGPAGGLIFYDKGSYSEGWRYLEAAPSDQGDGAPWGCYGTLIGGADGTAVGTGERNTIDIEAGCTTAGTAADICANLGLGGYSDWFLPSKDELNLMYTNLCQQGVGGFADGFYWSSSKVSEIYAWYQHFGSGDQTDNYNEGSTYRVRAVRAF